MIARYRYRAIAFGSDDRVYALTASTMSLRAAIAWLRETRLAGYVLALDTGRESVFWRDATVLMHAGTP